MLTYLRLHWFQLKVHHNQSMVSPHCDIVFCLLWSTVAAMGVCTQNHTHVFDGHAQCFRPWTKKFSSWNVNGLRAWIKVSDFWPYSGAWGRWGVLGVYTETAWSSEWRTGVHQAWRPGHPLSSGDKVLHCRHSTRVWYMARTSLSLHLSLSLSLSLTHTHTFLTALTLDPLPS